MYVFVLQTENNEISFDFVLAIKEAVKEFNWLYGEERCRYQFTDYSDLQYNLFTDTPHFKYVPVGSVEFVLSFYQIYHNITNIKPINIPVALRKPYYLNRIVSFPDAPLTILDNAEVFMKSADKFKEFSDIRLYKDRPSNMQLIISEQTDIISEWRTFVFNHSLIDMKNYLGAFDILPNVSLIRNMVNDYSNSPTAYTLDCAVIKAPMSKFYKTAILEVHPFFSCGLYGFNDYKNLPKMFIRTHLEILNGIISRAL